MEIPKRRFVIVTGASTGIGKACALYLDIRGFSVLAGVRKEADGDALRAEASPNLTPIVLDVCDPSSMQRAAGEVTRLVGEHGLAGLVNNAGIAVAGPIEFLPIERLRRQFEVNVIGLVSATQAFLPMIRLAKGRIVHISSVAGRVAMPFIGPYAASKHAVEALGDSQRVELKPWGIHVALIEPGVITTPIWEKSKRDGEVLRREMPPLAEEYYGQVLDAMPARTIEMEKLGVPPEQVARRVFHALTARRPRTRYLVGKAVRLQLIAAAILPDRALDWIVLKVLRIK